MTESQLRDATEQSAPGQFEPREVTNARELVRLFSECAAQPERARATINSTRERDEFIEETARIRERQLAAEAEAKRLADEVHGRQDRLERLERQLYESIMRRECGTILQKASNREVRRQLAEVRQFPPLPSAAPGADRLARSP